MARRINVRAPAHQPAPAAHLSHTERRAADRELWWRQTSFKSNELTTEAQAEGAIEGMGDDYKVADFFGTDFKYKRFDAVEAAPRNISTLSGAKRVVANTGSASWKRSKAGAYGDDAHVMEGGTK